MSWLDEFKGRKEKQKREAEKQMREYFEEKQKAWRESVRNVKEASVVALPIVQRVLRDLNHELGMKSEQIPDLTFVKEHDSGGEYYGSTGTATIYLDINRTPPYTRDPSSTYLPAYIWCIKGTKNRKIFIVFTATTNVDKYFSLWQTWSVGDALPIKMSIPIDEKALQNALLSSMNLLQD